MRVSSPPVGTLSATPDVADPLNQNSKRASDIPGWLPAPPLPPTRERRPHPADDAWFSMRLMRKDIGLALATARDEGVALPSAAVADDVLRRADTLGYGDREIAVLGEALARADLRPAA